MQCLQDGRVSSHLTWRRLHVLQPYLVFGRPVRDRAALGAGPSGEAVDSSDELLIALWGRVESSAPDAVTGLSAIFSRSSPPNILSSKRPGKWQPSEHGRAELSHNIMPDRCFKVASIACLGLTKRRSPMRVRSPLRAEEIAVVKSLSLSRKLDQ